MKQIKNFILVATLLLTGTINAQKWQEGKDLSYLKGEKEILLVFKYDNLIAGRNKPEAEYIKEKVEDYNKKEAGKGDAWAKSWVSNRGAVYEPKFEELFNKVSGENCQGDRQRKNAKYTIIIHCKRMEPGWNIGISKMPASCDFDLTIVETATQAVKSKGVLNNVPGSQFSGYDFDVASRIAECFAKCGKELGKKVGKATKS